MLDIRSIEERLGIECSSKYSLISWSSIYGKYLKPASTFLARKRPKSHLDVVLGCLEFADTIKKRLGKNVFSKPLPFSRLFKDIAALQANAAISTVKVFFKQHLLHLVLEKVKWDLRLTHDHKRVFLTLVCVPSRTIRSDKPYETVIQFLQKRLKFSHVPVQLQNNKISTNTLLATLSIKSWFQINNFIVMYRSNKNILIRFVFPCSNLVSPVMYLNNVKSIVRRLL